VTKPDTSAGGDSAAAGRRSIQWLGHATALIQTGGVRVLTDPTLVGRIAHLRRHSPAPPPPPELAAVLISHVHQDHLDIRSLKAVANQQTEVIVPDGARSLVQGLGFGAIREVRPGDAITVNGLEIQVVPAFHPAKRHPRAPLIPSVGYVADRIWFPGDTDMQPELADLKGEIDIALMPVWGWGPSLGPGHMDPKEAAEATAIVAPSVAIPIHWGTYLPFGLGKKYGRLLTVPPHAFAHQVAALAPATEAVVLPVGGVYRG
jgi:L-ascorbate metabolism protein UlaG (beta-lactamase superfamily)